MKKYFLTPLVFTVTLLCSAQQKNSLLDQSFWKTSPDVAAVKAEIEKGNSPTAATPNAFDVTVMAINNDAPAATIKFLLEQPGNEVNKLTHDNRIYLHWASYKGNVEIIEYLIAKGSDIHLEDSKGETPLTFAAIAGQANPKLYEAFFKAGIDPKKKYKDGLTLLLMAIPTDKNLAVSDYLTTKGLSIKDVDSNGNTAFDYAAKTGNVAFLKTLLAKGVKYTNNALLFAAQGTRKETSTLETYKYLVEELKIKPTTSSKSGETVLHYLANKPNQTEIIAYFLSKGVDPNQADKEGNIPLMLAAAGRETATLEQLIAVTKNTNAQNSKKETALTFAVKSGTPEAITQLLNHGADIAVTDKDGNNLGYYLIQSYRPQMGAGRGPEGTNTPKEDPFEAKIKILQDKGLRLSSPQKDGNTLYHLAVIKNDLNLLKKLAYLKIALNAKNNDGLTALHKAAMTTKDDTILKYLVSIGAQKESKTDFDETPYALAKENETLTKNKTDLEFLK
ncbi:ankyrin repeat domain-containing protein [Flavobacterium sp.]|uniref:ankyrin repeat domain-containing protein n=1 Tax=Flavobacterium sp. TaxID=239 RepID=UPI0022BE0123|nr:ankyrin repeat domain-containing protein [Flavobacterium sp.]MCZ8228200.1 ankyrin repeat domain-containing protein [Flavobacterium sp.]